MLKHISNFATVSYPGALDARVVEAIADLKGPSLSALEQIGMDSTVAVAKIAEIELRVREHIRLCESPIEQLAMTSMAFSRIEGHSIDGQVIIKSMGPAFMDTTEWPLFPDAGPVVIPQFVIGPYRLDFCARCISEHSGLPVLVAIECDGRDFHDQRWQRDRDTVRDCFFKQIGVQTHRLTGSEIYKLGAVKLCGRMSQIISDASQ